MAIYLTIEFSRVFMFTFLA